ncbi:MAG: ribonuclease HII [Anaerolineae bacterium]
MQIRRADSGPDLSRERALEALGYRAIAGVDEVGRGSWAGPVVAAAVVLPAHLDPSSLDGVRDSKRLTPRQRTDLFPRIEATAAALGVGWVGSRVLDRVGIVVATRRAMYRALRALSPRPDHVLVDYLSLDFGGVPSTSVTRGDSLCLSVACASVVAKVRRDRMMMRWGRRFPGYGFARHKGYGTPEHREALSRLGPCALHRRSFEPVARVDGARAAGARPDGAA